MTLPAQFCGVVIDEKAWIAVHELAHRKRLAEIRKDRWWGAFPWLMGFALGIYAACLGGQFFLAVMIAVCGGHFVWSNKRSILAEQAQLRPAPYSIDITIDEDGITEDDRGVRSSIGWRAMTCWGICSDTLVIGLADGRNAMLPAGKADQTQIPIQEVAELLCQKGVHEVHMPAAVQKPN